MKSKSTVKDFFQFLTEYNIVQLAVAFVMGAAADTLIKSIVNNLVMPLIQPLFIAGRWQDAVWNIGPFAFGLGPFFADALRFITLAFVVFFVVKRVIRIEKKP